MTFRRGDRVTVQVLTGLKGSPPFQETYRGFPVKIMAIADGYAMVRRPHCVPFVVSLKDLQRWNHKGTPGPLEEFP